MINVKTVPEGFSGEHCHDLGSGERGERDNRLETRVERERERESRENINIVWD